MFTMNTTDKAVLKHHALLRLMQLASPALPVGAYAYSQGLEGAVNQGWVHDEESAADWIHGLLNHTLCRLDVPVLARLYNAWRSQDTPAVEYWSAFLHASRESAELQCEDQQLGRALARLLGELGIAGAGTWTAHPCASFANLFAFAAAKWTIPLPETAIGYLWAWVENQTTAAMKLIPLGQSAGQRLLSRATETIPAAVQRGLQIADDEIGAFAPGLALASARHETQYTRLFRS
jgi:urease accessory protein